ncbi:MAG TPA: hypothetical protein VH572_07675 [Gaiella sp.]
MEGENGRRSVRSFVLGGLLGASAVVAALRRGERRRRRQTASGLSAFEGAPCYREVSERRRREAP